MTLGYSPDTANPKLPSYTMKICLIKAPYLILVGFPILLCRGMNQEVDFFDHEVWGGWSVKSLSKMNVIWSKKQAKHSSGKPWGWKRGFFIRAGGTDRAGEQGLLLAALAL